MSFLSAHELAQLGLQAYGDNVLISAKASLYNCARISIASNVRIDDFCVLSAGEGGIRIGSFVHLGVGATLLGAGTITMCDFSGLSSRVAVYSSSDDYSGNHMTNPTVPAELTRVKTSDVFIGRHVIVGCGSVILPGSILEEGVAVGALALVQKRCEAFTIQSGVPAVKVKERSRKLLELERQFFSS